MLTDDQLETISTKKLNALLKKNGIVGPAARDFKDKRRTLKNRKYAADGRQNKLTEMESLEAGIRKMETQLKEVDKEWERIQLQIQKLEEEEHRLLEVKRFLEATHANHHCPSQF